VEASFFSELSDLLDRLITTADPMMIVGDLNIRLDRPNDPASCRLLELFASYGLSNRVSSPTHDRGGLLDVVVTRDDSPISVDVIDPGFSDHRQLRWLFGLHKPAPAYETITYRPWRRLDVDKFRDELPRYSTAFFHYVRQHAAADHLTHGLMTTAALPSVNAGSLNVGRHVLRQMPVPGSSSDESIATWSLGNEKRSGSI